MTETDRARRIVARIQGFVRQAEDAGLRKIEIILSPGYYEQCLIAKGLPHGLGELGKWGPQQQARPLCEWRGRNGLYTLHFQAHGLSRVTGRGDGGDQEIAIVGE